MSSNKQAELIEQSFELLIKSMMQSKHLLVQYGSKLGLTSMQAMLILLLDSPKPMNSFTKVLNCDASNITGIVDGLEEKKLAARFPDNSDRRIKMIKLSPKGSQLRSKLLGHISKNEGSILLKLETSELKSLISLLTKMSAS